jgi:hypothetical protein
VYGLSTKTSQRCELFILKILPIIAFKIIHGCMLIQRKIKVGGPHNRSGRSTGEENLLPLPGIETWSFSLSLSRYMPTELTRPHKFSVLV